MTINSNCSSRSWTIGPLAVTTWASNSFADLVAQPGCSGLMERWRNQAFLDPA